MSRLLATIVVFCVINVSAAKDPGNLASQRPNIILIMTDDQGYGDLACHGNPHIRTPNLNKLHQQSTRFKDFHVSPTCSPTRSALMTSRHEFKNGITHTIHERERLTLSATTLPQVLKSAGYTTGIFGKWHLGDEDAYQPGQRGFDEVFIHGAGGIGQSYPGSCGDAPGNKYMNPVIRHNGTFEATKGYCTDVFFNQATTWIDSRRKGQDDTKQKPFFCYITPNAPHGPLICPEGSDTHYLEKKLPADVAKFYGMIENIDDNIGKLLAKLEEWKLDQETLVIFMTDNGTATGAATFNAGMRGQKGTPYTGGTRVPAFWRWTGTLNAGVDVAALTCHYDVLPTLANLAGAKLDAKTEKQVEGRNLVPLLLDPKAKWENRYFVTHVGRWPKGKAKGHQYSNASIRDERWMLVFPGMSMKKAQNNDPQLYDLRTDPAEKSNIFDKHPDVVKRMTAEYDKWWEESLPLMVNEDAVGPEVNPWREAYFKQFKGPGPNNARR